MTESTALTPIIQVREELAPMKAESWRLVAGYGWRYEVSDLGNVRSLVNNHGERRQTPKLLIPTPDGDHGQYRKVGLYLDGKLSNRLVHRLVLEEFVGPAPEGHESAHGDGIGHHNHLSNLSWKTKKANNADKLRHGTQTRGELHHRSKLSAEAIIDIRNNHRRGIRLVLIARKYGVTSTAIKSVLSGRTWSHVA